MNKNYIYNFFTLYSFYISFNLLGNTPLYESQLSYADSLYKTFNNPVKPTKAGIKCFLRHTYNNILYKDYLAINLSHINAFLSYSTHCTQPKVYVKSVLKIFTQKIKSSSFINAQAFTDFLEALIPVSQQLFSFQEKEDHAPHLKKQIKECLYNFLLKSFNALKKDPETALNILSDKLYEVTQSELTNHHFQDYELQFTFIQFLDLCLSKLIWSPIDQEEVWNSVKKIAEQLEDLLKHNVIKNKDTLNELYWSLICRFCYFLEIAGGELNTEAIQSIHSDITTKEAPLWSLPEQECFIKPKRGYLKEALFSTYAASKLRQSSPIIDTKRG